MSRRKNQKLALLVESLEIQDEILDEFGKEAVEKARQRLCTKCVEVRCPLLPLCLDGSDCSYFRLKEIKD